MPSNEMAHGGQWEGVARTSARHRQQRNWQCTVSLWHHDVLVSDVVSIVVSIVVSYHPICNEGALKIKFVTWVGENTVWIAVHLFKNIRIYKLTNVNKMECSANHLECQQMVYSTAALQPCYQSPTNLDRRTIYFTYCECALKYYLFVLRMCILPLEDDKRPRRRLFVVTVTSIRGYFFPASVWQCATTTVIL